MTQLRVLPCGDSLKRTPKKYLRKIPQGQKTSDKNIRRVTSTCSLVTSMHPTIASICLSHRIGKEGKQAPVFFVSRHTNIPVWKFAHPKLKNKGLSRRVHSLRWLEWWSVVHTFPSPLSIYLEEWIYTAWLQVLLPTSLPSLVHASNITRLTSWSFLCYHLQTGFLMVNYKAENWRSYNSSQVLEERLLRRPFRFSKKDEVFSLLYKPPARTAAHCRWCQSFARWPPPTSSPEMDWISPGHQRKMSRIECSYFLSFVSHTQACALICKNQQTNIPLVLRL